MDIKYFNVVFIILSGCATSPDCNMEIGLSPEVRCKLSNNAKTLNNEFNRLKMDVHKKNTNFNALSYTNSRYEINLAKNCIFKYLNNDKINDCSDLNKSFDESCFDKGSFFSCQLLYEVNSKILNNSKYTYRMYNLMKNKIIFYDTNNYFIPEKDYGKLDVTSLSPSRTPLKAKGVSVSTFTFLAFDQNLDGYISKKEIIEYTKSQIKKTSYFKKNGKEILKNSNISNKITDEYLRMYRVMSFFCYSLSFERDISVSEIKKCDLAKIDKKTSKKSLLLFKKYTSNLDFDKNGFISAVEFVVGYNMRFFWIGDLDKNKDSLISHYEFHKAISSAKVGMYNSLY